MTDDKDKTRPSRRRFLAGAAGLAAAGAAGGAQASDKNLPPNVADWSKHLGDGVAVRPYGQPSKFEKDVIRRDVQWLTASRESSVSFTPLHELDGIITPNGLCFERHSVGREGHVRQGRKGDDLGRLGHCNGLIDSNGLELVIPSLRSLHDNVARPQQG